MTRGGSLAIATIVAVVAACMGPSQARADELPLELSWSVPAECPDAVAVRAELARIVVIELGRSPTPLRASGEITRSGEGFRLALRTERDGEEGRRTLVAADCHDLLRAATLVLALAYGEGVALRTDEPTPPTPPPAIAPVAQEPTAPIGVPPAAAEGVRFTAGLELGASAGVLPAPSFEGALTAEIGEPWWRVRLRAASSPGAPSRVNESTSATFHSLTIGLEGCAGAPVDVVRGEVCLGALTTVVNGRAEGTTGDRDAWAPFFGLRGALGVAVRMGAVELRLLGGVVWSTSRPRFDVIGLGAVHQVGELAVTGALGIAWSP